MLEVSMVDVGVNSKQPFEDHLDDVGEILWERYAKRTREYFLIVQLVLDPRHQEINVLSSTDFERRFDIVAVCPQVFVLGACAHRWAALGRTEFHQDAI